MDKGKKLMAMKAGYFHFRTLNIFLWLFFCGVTVQAQEMVENQMNSSGWDQASQILKNINPPEFPDRVFQLTQFGAVSNGTTNCLPAFQAAIDSCSRVGGGKIVVTPGEYFVQGPIHLKSNVHLHLQEGVKIKFTSETDYYLPVVLTKWEGTELYNYSPLIYAYQVSNVAITGKGVIDGNSSEGFATWKPNQGPAQRKLRQMGNDGVPVNERVFGKGSYLRPSMIQFYGCKNILLEDISILDSPFWVIHPVFSNNIIVRNVTINSWNKNNDGCDPDASTNVLIENCDFNIGDDGVAIKAGRDQDGWRVGQPTENVIIRNCHINALCNGLCIGSEMSGGVRNIFMENCQVDTALSTVYFKSNLDRGGIIENVWVRNVQVKKAEGAFIRFETNYKGHRGNHFPPVFRNFTLENITCQDANIGIFAEGHKDALLQNITLKNIEMQKANHAYFIRYFSNFVMDNVRANSKLLPENPPKEMDKPQALKMGW